MIKVIQDDLAAMVFLERSLILPDRASFAGTVFVRGNEIIGAGGIDCLIGGMGSFIARHEATVHCAGHGWTQFSLGKFFGWVFDELGFKRLSAQVDVANKKSWRFAERLGFVREGVRRGAGPQGQDYIMLGCLPSEYRFRRH